MIKLLKAPNACETDGGHLTGLDLLFNERMKED
jgi:hypothetical protein